eukprot:1947495-Amphidinium_carterae.2
MEAMSWASSSEPAEMRTGRWASCVWSGCDLSSGPAADGDLRGSETSAIPREDCRAARTLSPRPGPTPASAGGGPPQVELRLSWFATSRSAASRR